MIPFTYYIHIVAKGNLTTLFKWLSSISCVYIPHFIYKYVVGQLYYFQIVKSMVANEHRCAYIIFNLVGFMSIVTLEQNCRIISRFFFRIFICSGPSSALESLPVVLRGYMDSRDRMQVSHMQGKLPTILLHLHFMALDLHILREGVERLHKTEEREGRTQLGQKWASPRT